MKPPGVGPGPVMPWLRPPGPEPVNAMGSMDLSAPRVGLAWASNPPTHLQMGLYGGAAQTKTGPGGDEGAYPALRRRATVPIRPRPARSMA